MAMIHVWNNRGSDKFTVYLSVSDDHQQVVFTFEDTRWRNASIKIRGTNQRVTDAEVTSFTTHECQIRLGQRLLSFNLSQQSSWPNTAYRYVGHETNSDMTYSRPQTPQDPGAYDGEGDLARAYDPAPLVREQIIKNIKNARLGDFGTTFNLNR